MFRIATAELVFLIEFIPSAAWSLSRSFFRYCICLSGTEVYWICRVSLCCTPTHVDFLMTSDGLLINIIQGSGSQTSWFKSLPIYIYIYISAQF